MKQTLSFSVTIVLLLVLVLLSLVNLLAIYRVQPVTKFVTKTQTKFVKVGPTATATPSAAVRYSKH